jgi:hypothetical protein
MTKNNSIAAIYPSHTAVIGALESAVVAGGLS